MPIGVPVGAETLSGYRWDLVRGSAPLHDQSTTITVYQFNFPPIQTGFAATGSSRLVWKY